MDAARENVEDTQHGMAERRKLNWSAIAAGVFATLGLQALMMYFGVALGLSAFDPYQFARSESPALSAATIAWLVVSFLGSSFFGAWIAGHWANLFEAEDAVIHGGLTWALSTILVTAGLTGVLQTGLLAATNVQPASATKSPEALTYFPLEDTRFSDFLLARARTWTPGAIGEPINVSADTQSRVKPKDLSARKDFVKFLASNTNFSDTQARDFLKSDQNLIANALSESEQRWEQQHAHELAQANRLRKTASAVAWTMTGVLWGALAAAVAGSWLGWHQRYLQPGYRTVAGPAGATPPGLV